jgi:hypothetical protein
VNKATPFIICFFHSVILSSHLILQRLDAVAREYLRDLLPDVTIPDSPAAPAAAAAAAAASF